MTTSVARFVITGEFITEHARALWREEDPSKGLAFLQTSIHELTEIQCLDILEGRSKLTGSSRDEDGVRLEKDAAEQPNLRDVLKRMKAELDEAQDERADALQMLNDDTVGVASVSGLRMVPQRKTDSNFGRMPTLKAGYDFEDTPDRNPEDKPLYLYRRTTSSYVERAKGWQKRAEADKPEPKPVPPTPDNKITSDTGWLSPKGEFYGCRYGQHNATAWALDLHPNEMDKAGWIRCTTVDGKETWFTHEHDAITDVQKEMITAYCAEKTIELPWWLRQVIEAKELQCPK